MNKEKSIKLIIIFLMLSNVYLMVSDILVLLGRTALQMLNLPSVFFSLFMYCIACLIVKNRYWISAFIFKALHTVSLAIASKYFLESGLTDFPRIAVGTGVVFLTLSLFAFYKLLKVPDITSPKYTYLWMQKINDYMKKKNPR